MSKVLKIAVDFDGTIVESTYPTIHGPKQWALEGLKQLTKAGHRIFIWTCRGGEALEAAKKWLDDNEVTYERINENCPIEVERFQNDCRKLGADVFIDDKAIGGMPAWWEIPDMVAWTAHKMWQDENLETLSRYPKIIALSGKRGAGKNTVAEIIQEFNPLVAQLAFADQLKSVARILTGATWDDVYSQEGKTKFWPAWNMTMGEILQKLGTDAIRNGLHDQAWILACLSQMEEDGYYVITDCRFANEADAIRAKGGIVIRVEGDPLKQQGDGTRDDNHPSETALDGYVGFSHIIHNTGTLEQLRQQVRDLLADPWLGEQDCSVPILPRELETINGGTDEPNKTA